MLLFIIKHILLFQRCSVISAEGEGGAYCTQKKKKGFEITTLTRTNTRFFLQFSNLCSKMCHHDLKWIII